MANDDKPSNAPRATIAIYDRPQWWRRRKTWMFALPVAVALASVAMFAWFAQN